MSFQLVSVMVLVGLSCLRPASAEVPSHDIESGVARRPVAAPSSQSRLTGCVHKNNEGEFVAFDVQLGDDFSHYEIKGSTAPNQGIFRTDGNFGGVRVSKRMNEDGLTRIEPIRNQGTVKIYPRQRRFNDVTLAGVEVGGSFTQKLFTNSLVFDHLTVDGKASRGRLFFNVFTRHYTCRTGNCRFGEYPLESTAPGGKVLLNAFGFINRNRMRVSMRFGDFALNGAIKFTDTTRTTYDGDGNSSTTVVATQGCFNVDVSKVDGSRPIFGRYGQSETADDRTARAFLAWLELTSHDLFAE